MRSKFKTFSNLYLTRWWLPPTIYLSLLTALALTTLSNHRTIVSLANIIIIPLTLALLANLYLTIKNLREKQNKRACINLASCLISAAATTPLLAYLLFITILGTARDHFADKLIIPKNIPITQPIAFEKQPKTQTIDTFKNTLIASLTAETKNTDDPTITADITTLLELNKQSPKFLRHFLKASPAWRVFPNRGHTFATRRWITQHNWLYTSYGHYSNFDLNTNPTKHLPRFLTRLTLGLDGIPPHPGNQYTTFLTPSQTKPLIIHTENFKHESKCIIKSEKLTLSIFEQTHTTERKITKAALTYLSHEFAELIKYQKHNHKNSAPPKLPNQPIKQGPPTFQLVTSYQPGIYDYHIWLNPGQPGKIYLKAFEITQNTPLSPKRLKQKSTEYIGWSNNPKDLFLANAYFTIYEGDWGKPYAARFEVWFTPDSGKPDTCLLKKNFIIQGWQR